MSALGLGAAAASVVASLGIGGFVVGLQANFDIPATPAAAYVAAAQRYGVDWRWLACIYKGESNHGRLWDGSHEIDPDTGLETPALRNWDVAAYSVGPGQFQEYNVPTYFDDSNPNPQSIFDAAEATAKYLVAHGYRDDPRDAVRAYNGSGAAAEAYADAKAACVAGLPPLGATVDLSVLGGNADRLDPDFASRLAALFTAAPGKLGITSGFRTADEQRALRVKNCTDPDLTPPGDCHPATAKVGTSEHERGVAADLHGDPAVIQWAHANAARFGLTFDVASEDWHIAIDPGAAPTVPMLDVSARKPAKPAPRDWLGWLWQRLHGRANDGIETLNDKGTEACRQARTEGTGMASLCDRGSKVGRWVDGE